MSGSAGLLALFFFAITLVILGLLHFHINFTINLPIYTHTYLLGFWLGLYWSYRSVGERLIESQEAILNLSLPQAGKDPSPSGCHASPYSSPHLHVISKFPLMLLSPRNACFLLWSFTESSPHLSVVSQHCIKNLWLSGCLWASREQGTTSDSFERGWGKQYDEVGKV